jgi:hypothetical protein
VLSLLFLIHKVHEVHRARSVADWGVDFKIKNWTLWKGGRGQDSEGRVQGLGFRTDWEIIIEDERWIVDSG